MLTSTDVQNILRFLGASADDLSKDVDCIVYRTDVFSCGEEAIISRHIDIEFTFGEHYEIADTLPLFDWICDHSGLAPSSEETAVLLYQQACMTPS